ncbi:MAG: hypothetical protein EPN91_09440 [Salinibacterium sp.]|nr:MAG: hypothetical protein EPN91_09440 [Salinibacterium sp.]
MNFDPNNLPFDAVWIPVIIALAIWSGIWKAIGLYRAGADRSVGWFIVMFILNTVGILEIIYIFAVSRPRRDSATHARA